MNTKQKVVLFITLGLLILFMLSPLQLTTTYTGVDDAGNKAVMDKLDFSKSLNNVLLVVIAIIGGLLTYALRSTKKEEQK